MQERRRPNLSADSGMNTRVPPSRPENVPLARRPADRSTGTGPRARHSAEGDWEVSGVYVISVAARILDMHPQTLRKYERLGLINPNRTVGMLRLYSREDIRKILLIRHLMDNLGLNLAGVEFVLTLVDNLVGMKERLASATQGTPLQGVIDREMSQLFRNLNLPVEE